MTTLEIVRNRVGSRSKITRAEMAGILSAIHAEHGADCLANSYVVASFDQKKPWLTWCEMVRGITVVSYSARGNLRDGGARYDQPGSMHPGQRAEVSFVADGGVATETLPYLRQHCDRLLIVIQGPEEVFLPPGLQKQYWQGTGKSPQSLRVSPADAAAIELLWLRRNQCHESEIDRIDQEMLKIVAPGLKLKPVYSGCVEPEA